MRCVTHILFVIALLWASLVQAAAPQVDLSNVVRVRVGGSWGSGAYLGQRLVLTCAHLFRDEPSMEGDVWFNRTGEHHAFILRQIDHQWDQAVLELRSQPTSKGFPLAGANPQPGEKLYAYGYGRTDKVYVTEGTVTGYKASNEYPQVRDWLEMSGRVDQGSSGGPILNQYGQVVGNLWGTADSAPYRTVGVLTGRTRRFLLPWNAQLEAHAISNGWCPGGTCPTPRTQVAPRVPRQQAPPRLIPSPSTAAPSTAAPTPVPDMTPLPAPSTCAPDIQPTQPVAEFDYQRLIDELKSDADFVASLKGDKGDKGDPGESGVAGPAGPMGQNGMDGQDGRDAELTAEHLATMTAAILQQLKTDPTFIEASRGPAGSPGESPDLATLIARVEALEQNITVTPPLSAPDAAWSHLVLLASARAEYWPRLSGDLQRAQGYYHQLKHLEPPVDRDLGPMPMLVAYQNGKAVKSWTGLHPVTQAFSSITRGELDRFIFAEGGE